MFVDPPLVCPSAHDRFLAREDHAVERRRVGLFWNIGTGVALLTWVFFATATPKTNLIITVEIRDGPFATTAGRKSTT